MTNYFSSDFKLGILGGGQLGKMLLYETRKYDIQTYVLDPSDQAPSKIACNSFTQGDLMDFDTVYDFAKNLDVVTFEIEHVNLQALEQLEQDGVKVYPSANTLRTIQNKATQKAFYKEQGIATADFSRFASITALQTAVANKQVTLPFIWKSAQFGYDGNGVKVIREAKDLQGLPDVECIAEHKVDFAKEISVIVSRNPDGMVKTYPVVEMEFHPEANQVEYVICPARIDAQIAAKAENLALEVATKLEAVGLLAVEMFITKDNKVLVNEVAPRPHNSGHYSIEGSYTNQFEQHIRAILNLPLGDTQSKVAAVMVNLSGAPGYSGAVHYKGIEQIMALSGVTPHIYGKKQTRPFRKMGHVTIVDKDIAIARKKAEQVKNTITVISK